MDVDRRTGQLEMIGKYTNCTVINKYASRIITGKYTSCTVINKMLGSSKHTNWAIKGQYNNSSILE